jgi:hypothetical protein
MGPVECYSCMSLSYQSTWGALRHIYQRPHSFSDKCNEPFLGKGAIGETIGIIRIIHLNSSDRSTVG